MPTLPRREFVGTSLALIAAPAMGQDTDGLEVHEWGVLTVPDGATWAAARTAGVTFDAKKAELASKPPEFALTWTRFVGDQIEEWKQEPRVVFKPVIYFYSKKKVTLKLKIGVPLGRPAVWWPPANEIAPKAALPEHSTGMGEPDPDPPKIESIVPEKGHLAWNGLVVDPATPEASYRKVAADHWWHTARQVDAAGVTAGPNSERFVFYDALTPVSSPIEAAWNGDDAVAIQNLRPCHLPFVIAIRVKDGKASIAAATQVPRGDTVSLALKPGDSAALTERLKAQGLFAKEAAGMTAIWTPELFTAEGVRVIVSLPGPDIETLLPMTIDPAPARLVRVLLAHIECLSTADAKTIDELIDRLGSDDVGERDAANDKLKAFGPRAERALRKAVKSSADAEVRHRAETLLKSLGVKP